MARKDRPLLIEKNGQVPGKLNGRQGGKIEPFGTVVPAHDFSKDPTYKELIQDMTGRQIEFARGLILYDNDIEVGQHLFRHYKDMNSLRAQCYRMSNDDRVLELYRYLRKLRDKDEDAFQHLDTEECLRLWSNDIRSMPPGKERARAIADYLKTIDKLDGALDEENEDEEHEEALNELNELMGGNGNGEVVHTD